MKINNIQSQNFGALVYTPNSKLYVSKYLMQRDIGVLDSAKEKLKNTKFWDLEVTGAGLRIAAKHTKDAFLDNFYMQYPKNSDLMVESVYDGHSDKCQTGHTCQFGLHYSSRGYAMLAYEEFTKKPLVEKAIEITEILEKQAKNGTDPIDADSSIAVPNFIDKLRKFFF